MNKIVLSGEQARTVDKIAIEQFGIPGIVLMENAGRGMSELLCRQSPSGRVTVLCGVGNNAGDGFVIARHLENRGIDVLVVLLAPQSQLRGDARTNYEILVKAGTKIIALDVANELDRLIVIVDESDWVVDALLGTGLRGAAREPFSTVISVVNGGDCKVLAVDVPSGLDADTGPVLDNTIQATITGTCVALKQGLLKDKSRDYVGQIEVIDIGIPRCILTNLVRAQQS